MAKVNCTENEAQRAVEMVHSICEQSFASGRGGSIVLGTIVANELYDWWMRFNNGNPPERQEYTNSYEETK